MSNTGVAPLVDTSGRHIPFIHVPVFSWQSKPYLIMDFLIVDDDQIFRETAVMMIDSEEPHHAEAAANPQEALAALSQRRFDVVLLDLVLGAQPSLELLAEIIKQHPRLPVVILTAHSSIKWAVDAMRAGSVDFLEKPLFREQIVTLVARLERLREMNQKLEQLERED